MDNKTVNIEELLYVFKKRIKVIILCILMTTLGAGFLAYKMQPSYEAKVKIFAGKSENIQSDYNKDEIANYQSLINSYIEIIKTEDFMNKVIKKANLNMGAKELLQGVVFSPSGSAPVFTISYKSGDYKTAEKVVKAITEEFEAGVQEVILNTYTKVIDSVKVVTYEPKQVKVVILGFIAGLILAIGLVLVLDYLDDTVAKKEQLEKLIPVPVLGEISVEQNEKEEAKGIKKSKKQNGKRYKEEAKCL